jgi:hypothetical protein
MKKVIDRHKKLWKQKSFSWRFVSSITLLVLSMFVNYFANVYTTNHVSNYVSDIILDNLPVINVDFIFVEGAIALWLFAIFLLLRDPQKIPFAVKSIAVFVLIRSFFIMLTHIALPPDHAYLDPDSTFRYITAGNDMFFSSHTGLPYLLALNFWRNKKLRIFFVGASIVFAASVLLGHLHYSIDVFAAFFITYSIFHICQRLFPKDYKLLIESINDEK